MACARTCPGLRVASLGVVRCSPHGCGVYLASPRSGLHVDRAASFTQTLRRQPFPIAMQGLKVLCSVWTTSCHEGGLPRSCVFGCLMPQS